ncbi:DNA-directed RNA polymerase subunit RPC12/RpoP [Bradyrhizobium sp. USDA 3315]
MRSPRIIRFGFARLPRIIAVRSYNVTPRAIQALQGHQRHEYEQAAFPECNSNIYFRDREGARKFRFETSCGEYFETALARVRRSVTTLVYHCTNCTRFDRERLSQSDGPTRNSILSQPYAIIRCWLERLKLRPSWTTKKARPDRWPGVSQSGGARLLSIAPTSVDRGRTVGGICGKAFTANSNSERINVRQIWCRLCSFA